MRTEGNVCANIDTNREETEHSSQLKPATVAVARERVAVRMRSFNRNSDREKGNLKTEQKRGKTDITVFLTIWLAKKCMSLEDKEETAL